MATVTKEKYAEMKEVGPGSKLATSVVGSVVQIGNVRISFERTLRIPDDNNEYPLPPSLGHFPVKKVSDYLTKVPKEWREHGGVFLPMYQREAMWLHFSGQHWRPNALKVAIGKINALTGKPWEQVLHSSPQDYVVIPDQPWLDGINSGDGFIKQFVAMPLGMGYTVEGQITGKEEFGGIQLIVFDPKSGKFPDEPPKTYYGDGLYRGASGQGMMTHDTSLFSSAVVASSGPPTKGKSMMRNATLTQNMGGNEFAGSVQDMGLSAGGKMRQKIYPDSHGLDTWDVDAFGRVYVHIVNSTDWKKITGEDAPATPVDSRTYTQHGYPWFDLYDEHKGDVEASETLSGVKSVKEMDKEKGFGSQQDDSSVKVKKKQIKTIAPKHLDGSW